jgi:hypothetical protein
MMFVWIFYGATIVGLGALFLSLVYRKTLLSFSCCFWIGLALLVTGLQTVNLFCQINLFVVRSICCLGLFSFWLFRSRLDVSFWPGLKTWHKLLFLLATLWIADRGLAFPYVYDSGLYHFNSVRWANEQPLPPGLGNLHGRLAFNQSYFLFVSFVNLLPERGAGHNFANSLLLVFAMVTILEKGQFARDRGKRIVLLLLGPLLFFFLLLFNHTDEPRISSPSPEVAMLCLQFTMFTMALVACDRKSREVKERQTVEVVGLLLVSGLAVTFKLSSILFSAGISLFAVIVYILNREPEQRLRIILLPMIALLALGSTWFIRSVIASGYLIYPIVGTACPVSWKVPPDLVKNEAAAIYGFAREPDDHWPDVLAGKSWILPWSHRVAKRLDFILPLSLLGLSGLLLVILFIVSPKAAANGLRKSSDFIALASVCIASLCFWFLTAPDPRFLGAIFAFLPLCLLGIGLELMEDNLGFSLTLTGAIVLLGLGIYLALAANGLGLLVLAKKQRIASRIPVPQLVQKVTDSGLRVWVPVAGYQTWDAPLPATPYFRRNLRLRGQDLASGFCLGTRQPKGHD